MKHPLTTHFNQLRKATLPPEGRRKAAKEIPAQVRKFLEELETFKTIWPHSQLAGSYAQKLCVGDVKDVDFLIRVVGIATGEDMTSPRKMISDLAHALEGLAEHLGYEKSKITIETARRSVHVYFKDEEFHLDVVPCIADDGLDKPLYVPCKNAGAWVKSNPIGYVKKLDEINAANGYNVKRLARIFKHFIHHQMTNSRPKSYWLGALLLQIIDEEGFDATKTQGELFNWLVSKIHAKYLVTLNTSTTATPNVKDPMLGHNISWNWSRRGFETFMARLEDAKKWSEKALADDVTQEKAIEYWQKLFGDKFPTSVEEEAKELATAMWPGNGSKVASTGLLVAASVASIASVASKTTRFHGGKIGKNRYFPTRTLNAGLQQLGMERHFPTFTFKFEGSTGVWKGTLQPRPGSPVYQVTIRHKPRSMPEVRIKRSQIDQSAPHIYRPGGLLCLFYPKDKNWHSGMFIAETIIPWTAQWLLYYELWKDTGEWLGPESPHNYPSLGRFFA